MRFLEELARGLWEGGNRGGARQRISLSLPMLTALPAAVRKRVTACAYSHVAQGQSLSAAHMDYIEKCIAGRFHLVKGLCGNIDVFVQEEVLILARRVDIERIRICPAPPLGSSTVIDAAGISIQLQTYGGDPLGKGRPAASKAAWREMGVWWADLDLDTLQFPFMLGAEGLAIVFSLWACRAPRSLKTYSSTRKSQGSSGTKYRVLSTVRGLLLL